MKLSDFKLKETRGTSPLDWQYFAEVVVHTGALWWKKRETQMIRREFCGSWHFVSTGEFTRAYQAEDLARAWQAQTGQKC